MKGRHRNGNMHLKNVRAAYAAYWYGWDGVCGKEGLEKQSDNKWESGKLRRGDKAFQ